jgi:hypothetical protein
MASLPAFCSLSRWNPSNAPRGHSMAAGRGPSRRDAGKRDRSRKVQDGYETGWVEADRAPIAMRRTLFLAGVFALLTACYIVHQDKFEEAVHSWIRIDMPFATAISILGTKGMTCTGGNPASCSRIRQGLQPYSCVERVMVRFAGPNMLVDAIQIPKIGCAGL